MNEPFPIRAFRELRRRRVFSVAVVYVPAAWVVIEATATVFPLLGFAEWAVRLVLVLALLCFPLAMALAWLYDITPHGIRRTPAADGGTSAPACEPAPSAAGARAETAAGETMEPAGAANSSKSRVLGYMGVGLLLGVTTLGAYASSQYVIEGRPDRALAAAYSVKSRGDMIDYSSRDWLVLASFDSPAGDSTLALAFQTLLVQDIETGEHVRVVGGMGGVSRGKLAEVLARMLLPAETRIGTELACQIAEREGAAGVLSGQVLPLGDSYVLAASILEARECVEVIRVSATAPREEVAGATMAVSWELRKRLGESRSTIRGSPPLLPLTASSTEALRLLNQLAVEGAHWDTLRFRELASSALRLEPDFAMAHLELFMHFHWWQEYDRAIPHLVRAFELRDRLTRKERLVVEAHFYRTVESDPQRALERIERLIADYPEVEEYASSGVAVNAAWLGDWERTLHVSLEHIRRWPVRSATEGGNNQYLSRGNAAAAACALDRPAIAATLTPFLSGFYADIGSDSAAARLENSIDCREWGEADRLCGDQGVRHPFAHGMCGSVRIVRGKLRHAASDLEPLTKSQAPELSVTEIYRIAASLAEIDRLRGTPEQGWRRLQWARQTAPLGNMPASQRHLPRFILCTAAVELGRPDAFAECAIESEDPAAWDADGSFHWVLRAGAWSRRLLAARSLARGDAAAALRQAREAVQSNFENPASADHLLLARTFDAMGQTDSARHHYVESTRAGANCFSCYPASYAGGFYVPHTAPAYRRAGELAEAAADTAAALQYYRRFLDLWQYADAELQPQVDVVRRRVAALSLLPEG
jgi:tetratricopeptide (TPR) repeat protein